MPFCFAVNILVNICSILSVVYVQHFIVVSVNYKSFKEFDALDFIASICSHIPNMGEQMVK
ncbi:MAG: hypothetical protein M1326_02930 [Cyanobacteria bacterium]|nr:hypothetical protein [Cyanobacteriota bacterium]